MADPTRLGLTPEQYTQLMAQAGGVAANGMQFVDPGSSMELGPMSVGPQALPQPVPMAPPMQFDLSGAPADATSRIVAPGTNTPLPVSLPDAPSTTGYTPRGAGAAPAPEQPAFQSTGDPQRDALLQAVNAPADLDSNQLLLLNPKQGGGRGGMATSTTKQLDRTVQLDSPELKAARAKEDALRAQIGERTVKLAETQAQTQSQVADIELRYAEGLKSHAAETMRLQQENQKRVQDLDGEMVRQRNDYVKAADSIDPQRIVRGKQWLVALSTGLGAWGATISGSRNFAMDTINAALERDLDAQKTALGAKREAMSFTQQRFTNNLAMFSNQLAAREATKADAYAVTAAVARSKATRLKGTEMEAGALTFVDELERQANAAHMNSLQLEAGTLQTRQVTAPAAGGGKSQTPLEQLVEAARAKKVLVEAFGAKPGGNTEGLSEQSSARVQHTTDKLVGAFGALDAADKLLGQEGLAQKTNRMDRAMPDTLIPGIGGSTAQEFDTTFNTFVANRVRAITGLTATDQQMERYERMYGREAKTSDGIETRVKQGVKDIYSEARGYILGLNPEERAVAIKRMQAAGVTPARINSALTGKAPASGGEAGDAKGLGHVR